MNDMIRKMVSAGLVRGIDKKKRTITAYASTNEWDRYGERFEPDAFKEGMINYLKNPVVLWAHDYGRPPIAKTIDYQFDAKGLILTMEFADTQEARDIFELYEGGFLNAFSVGFKPVEVGYEERVPGTGEMGAVFKRAELLENSAVPVPANPGALVMKGLMGAACRAFGVKEPEEKPQAGPPAPAPAGDQLPAEGAPSAAPASQEAPPAAPEPAQAPAEPAPAPEAEPPAPANMEPVPGLSMKPEALKAALAYLLALGKIIKGQGKVGDEELRSLLIQTNNLCRELVYGPGAAPIEPSGEALSDAEIASLVKEYELLSEALAKNPAATDADRKELDKIGDLIAGTISRE